MLSFLIEKEFKQLARNKIIPRMLVALPLMAMLVFPWAANLEIKNVRVDVVDNDHSPLSQRLVAEIGGSAYFNISGTSDSYPDALRKVDSDEADMIFVVPQNFEKDLVNGQGTQVQIAANSVNGTKGTLGSSHMVSMISGSTALREYSEKVKVTSAGQDIPSFSVSPLYKFNPSLDYKVFMVPALMVMLLTIICGFFPALNIVGEKESGTIEQINVTPVGKFQFILAKLIPLWIIGIVIMGLSLLLAKVIYGIAPAGSIWTLMLFTGVYILGGDGFVETDFLGNVISGSKKPTREVFLHGLLYRLMPDAGSIVHTHSPWAVTWSYGHDELPRKTYHSELKIKHRIPVLHIPSPIVRPEDEPVIHTMLEKIPNISAFLLEGHGVVALGKTAKEAEHLAELIEETSQIVVCTTLLNKLRT